MRYTTRVGALDDLPVLEETDVMELWDLAATVRHGGERCGLGVGNGEGATLESLERWAGTG